MTLTGPVRIPGRAEALRPEEAEDFLQVGQYLTYADSEARADALESLTRQVFDRLTTGTLPSPRRLGAVLGPLVPTGDLRVWSTRPEEQDLLGELGVTGELPEAGGHDLVRVSSVNGGQNKIDVFLHRKVEVEPTASTPTPGEVVSTVRVTLRNDAPATGPPALRQRQRPGRPGGARTATCSASSPRSAWSGPPSTGSRSASTPGPSGATTSTGATSRCRRVGADPRAPAAGHDPGHGRLPPGRPGPVDGQPRPPRLDGALVGGDAELRRWTAADDR